MNDHYANTMNQHLQMMRNEQNKQTKALERIAEALEALVQKKS